MSGGGTTTNQITNKDPWAPSVPMLNQINSSAQDLYNSGAGSQTWGGNLVSPLSQPTQMGINSLSNTAQSQIPTAGQPLAYGQSLIQNNGLTSGYQAPLATYGNVTANASQPTSSATNLAGMASGTDAGKDPYMQQMLQDNANIIGNRVASQMSGAGRLGSFGYGDAMARSITAANAPILSQEYESDKNRQLSAAGQIDQSNNANAATQMGAAAGQTGIANAGSANAAQWAGMIPQLQQASYAPSQEMLGAGSIQDQYNQALLSAQQNQFNTQQQMPWTQLAKYSGAVSGLAPLTGSSGTATGNSATSNQTPWTQVAGLGIAGLGLLSDRNEKTDIKKLGTDEATGLPMYAYRYKDDPKDYPKIVGPMAQDIEAAMPGSTERVGGKLYIKPQATMALGILATFANKKVA